jgi:hypothetical protein
MVGRRLPPDARRNGEERELKVYSDGRAKGSLNNKLITEQLYREG